mmetsp:Transcript_1789/g.4541  ORF Transcript_1789/g.4541 Transcript_1789/m.4541 type:complete len:294 (+) Transcript_1789:70-951(+)
MSMLWIMAGLVASTAGVSTTGPYNTAHATFEFSKLDITNRHIDVVYPIGITGGSRFPLIAYAHGFSDRGLASYPEMWPELASWGFVVAGTLACEDGCFGDCKSLLLDPPCFGHYYKQQLDVIEWAMTGPPGVPVNVSNGVGVAGHSMGGQSTLFSAAYNASTHNIKAAAMHHAFTHTYPAISSVPFIAFTGTDDTVAPPEMAEKIFNAHGTFRTRGLVNKKGANHHEPSTDYNPKLAQYTVALFKIFVEGTNASFGHDWSRELFGDGPDSLCGGGDGAMETCTLLDGGTAPQK